MEIEAGTEVGPYQIVERLGHGGMATVYKAHHTVLKRDAALKFLHPAFLEDPEFVKRFRHEARMIAGLEHPNIVPVFDFAEHDGLPYLAMKFVPGVTLKAAMFDGPVTRQQACRIADAVGQGMAYAHAKGILHRDVKPSNILMGEGGGIYLADFGIARIAASSQSTLSSEMLIGTPQYISPEQARSEPDLDERTDVYSLGIVLYELMVGEVPFDADTPISVIHDHLYLPPTPPSELDIDIPAQMERVILKSLAKERADRYESIEAQVHEFLTAADAPEATTFKRDLQRYMPSKVTAKPAVEDDSESSARPGEARLVSTGGLEFQLAGERLLIGRADPKRGIAPTVDLAAAEPEDPSTGKRRRTVHREQAWITRQHEQWGVEVIAGVEERAWINGDPMEAGRRYVLQAGDRLKFGAVDLEFQSEGLAGEAEGQGLGTSR